MDLNRREFVAAAAALSATRIAGANERLGVGLIGCGGQGSHHLGRLVGTKWAQVLAVCDIYKPRLDAAATMSKAEPIHDYRKLLDRRDIDAVWIATPDHWHAKMTIDAMEAGKDVYLEKPMTHTWQEAREVNRTARRTGRVVQVGSQDTSRPFWHKARELVAAGELGKLVWSQTTICRNIREGDWTYGIDLNATSSNLDWKAFLGPAPWRPYDPERFFRWRKYFDYSGGIWTDLFVHVLHSLCIPLGNPCPTRVVSGGGVYLHKDRETPDTSLTIIDYEGEHSVFVGGTQANEQGVPVTIRGHEATMYLSSSNIKIQPERIYADKREEKTVPGGDVADSIGAHHANFFDCVKRRELLTNCSIDLAYHVTIAVDLAVESYRRHKVMRFDPKKEELVAE